MATGPDAGWYDDGSGKQRWWDGVRWTDQFIDLRENDVRLHTDAETAPFGGEQDVFAGIVVDGRSIRCGALTRPITDAAASCASGAELIKRGRLATAAGARALYSAAGPLTPRLLKRTLDARANYLVVELGGEIWLAPVPAGTDAEAQRFAKWINTVAQHYRYRAR